MHWPVDDDGRTPGDRDVRPAGVRPRPPFRRLPRLRHLPRHGAARAPATPARRRAARRHCPRLSSRRRMSRSKILPFPMRRRRSRPPQSRWPPPPLPEPGRARPSPSLSPGEHSAFQELARELNERLKQPPAKAADSVSSDEPFVAPAPPPRTAQAAPQRRRHARYAAKAGRSSTACRSAFWSIGSTTCSTPTALSSIGPAIPP